MARKSRSRSRRSQRGYADTEGLTKLVLLAAVGIGGYYLYKKLAATAAQVGAASQAALPAAATTPLATPQITWL
jgi:hypothetical protein